MRIRFDLPSGRAPFAPGMAARSGIFCQVSGHWPANGHACTNMAKRTPNFAAGYCPENEVDPYRMPYTVTGTERSHGSLRGTEQKWSALGEDLQTCL